MFNPFRPIKDFCHELREAGRRAELATEADRAYRAAVSALVPAMRKEYAWLIGEAGDKAQYHRNPVGAFDQYMRDHMPDGLTPVEQDALRAACAARRRGLQTHALQKAYAQQMQSHLSAYDREGDLRL